MNNNTNTETKKIINTIFILQIQLINNTLKVFVLLDFPIPKNYSMILNAIIYDYKNLRNLQQEKGTNVLVTVYSTKDSDKNKITVLSSDNEFNKENNIKRVEVQEIEINNKENNDLIINILDNNCLDTAKVENKINNEGEVDYSNISSDYRVYQYKINSASKRCNFNLESDSIINEQNKEIKLNFKNDKSDIITSFCSLSQNNGNSIICKLEKNVDSNKILEDYIESNNQETFTIIQSDKSKKLYLNCLNSEKPKDSTKGRLKLGVLIVVILLIILLVSGILFPIICCKKGKKGSGDNNRNYKHKTNYENNTQRGLKYKSNFYYY